LESKQNKLSRVKHSHIVPQFYLKYFANTKGKVHVFDKPTFTTFEVVPSKIGKIGGFYDIDEIDDAKSKQIIEHKLGEIESETAPVYKELIAKLRLNKFSGFSIEERTILSKFIQSQLFRTEGHRNRISQTTVELLRQLKNKMSEAEFQQAQAEMDTLDSKSIQLSMINSVAHTSNFDLSDRIWVVHKNKTKYKFFTSDNPVSTYNHGDFFKIEHEIFIPLTPSYILSILIPQQLPEFRVWNNKILDLSSREASKFYNSIIILSGERQVYSSENHFKFLNKILGDNQIFKNKNQPRIRKNEYH